MLDAVELSCSRGSRQLFSNLSMTVLAGRALIVVGENGTGKTSLLRALCGFLTPDHGTILWQGHNIRQLREGFRGQVVYLGHNNGIKDELTPIENQRVAAGLTGVDGTETRIVDALNAVGLRREIHSLPTRVLSQGQKRRVALARLWLTE